MKTRSNDIPQQKFIPIYILLYAIYIFSKLTIN